MKKLIAGLLVFCLVLAMPLTAAASIWGANDFTDSPSGRFAFGWEPASYFVFGGVIDRNLDIFEMYPGSSIFIPIMMQDNDTGIERIAVERDLRDANVTLSHWVTRGEAHVESVQIVDSRRDRISDMDPGMYVRITLSNHLPSMTREFINVHLALNVNRVFFPFTEIEVAMELLNRAVYIDRETVFGALTPTLFEVEDWFQGQVSFDMGAGVRFTTWVAPRQMILIDYTSDAIGTIVDAHPDATLLFHRFMGNQAHFGAPGTLEIPISPTAFVGESGQPELFVYQIHRGSYHLTELPAGTLRLDLTANRLLIQTQSLGEYLISNIPLDTPISGPSGILQGGNQTETVAEPPAEAPDAPGINVINTGAQNPATGIVSAYPIENAIVIAIFAFAVAAWQVGKKLKSMRK
ncbi:MAG: hypothetical protein FWE32_00560 [Oscillospiraceae bacterium]|nr:hypothetical protein [Oscillospiraceae bacterium]